MSRALAGPFNDLILAKMREMGVDSLEEFARRTGFSRGTLYYLVRGRQTRAGTWVKPSVDTILTLARVLDVPAHELLYRLDPEAPGHELMGVPVVGFVGGGPAQGEEIEERYVQTRRRRLQGLLAFKVKRNSMCGGKRPICHGDIIIVNTQDKGEPGAIVVARLGDEYVVKKLGEKYLFSTNPEENHGPPSIPLEEVDEIVGRVVEVQAMIDKDPKAALN